ncbi:MAG: phage major capsid protein [Methanolobus sp.]|nr:phage major capsid protein [Methanolobus sp.]
MNIKERLAKIAKELSDYEVELRNASQDRITEIKTEVETLMNERASLIEAQRQETLSMFNSSNKKEPESNRAKAIEQMSKREKLALIVGSHARGKKFTDVEIRALGSALTTTATTYVAATAEVNGVNNAGVMIPINLVMDLLRDEGNLSPILRDIAMTSVPGLVDFPYRKTRDKARAKAEGATGLENQIEWGKLSGAKGYLQTIIAVTDEVRSLSDIDFGAYIIEQLFVDLNDDWVNELIYGTGQDNRIKGITYGATAAVSGGYTSGAVVAAIIAGIKLCTGKYRRGAKIYVAQDVYDEIITATDDNGNFKYPIFNNPTGINSIAPLRVEIDENLTSGQFIIGNVSKFYKVNSLIPLRIETEREAVKGITKYIASEYCAAVPHPSAFIHGTKKA